MENQINIHQQNQITQIDKDKNLIWVLLFGVITAVMWQFETGRYILYPFTILGTWFHEMSHGLTALLLGGTFQKLDLNLDGSGVAYFYGNLFLGRIGNAIVAAAGPLGPAMFGSLMIISSKNPKTTKFFLSFLVILMLLSIIIWIRTIFGAIIIALFGVTLLLILLKTNLQFQKRTLQFLGIEAILSLFLSISYLFSNGGVVNGKQYYSDTYVIQEALFLPYWFWGGIILIISIFFLILSFKKVLISKKI